MRTSYDVSIWDIRRYRGKRATTFYVRWKVAGTEHQESFKQLGLADGFRSELVIAALKGEPFEVGSGLPVSKARARLDTSFYALCCAYADLKWPHVAATTRRTHAEALTALAGAMIDEARGGPAGRLLRRALCQWAFNTVRRDDPAQPEEVRAALRWVVQRHSRPVSALAEPEVLRSVRESLTVTLEGRPAAPSVFNRRRKIFNALLGYAVEKKILPSNPLRTLNWRPPSTVRSRPVQAIDRRRVASPLQVRTLLQAVREQRRSGPRLVAYLACLYFAALRPEEAGALARPNLAIPEQGWGELLLDTVEPYAGRAWTDNGEQRVRRRQLKQREVGEIRPVPCCPELTAILHAHIDEFGFGPDGRLFTGELNEDELPKLTINCTWARARQAVFTPEMLASPLVATPYDLRHAGVSAWLSAGIPVPQVAEWAGHSQEILLRIYAHCIDGSDQLQRQRIQRFFGYDE